jgi:hypothetical protein
MHRVLVVASFAVYAQAGTIQGIVLEHASGRPVVRTVVRLDPVPQASAGRAKGQPLATRAGRSGEFAFPYVGPGLYLLHAVRDGYFEAAYGQRLPTGRGTTIEARVPTLWMTAPDGCPPSDGRGARPVTHAFTE